MAKKKQAKNKPKSKKKRTAPPLPRITLQSPPSDVVTVTKALAQFYQGITPEDLDLRALIIPWENMESFRMVILEPTKPYIESICRWLKRKDKDLYDLVWEQYRELKKVIEEADKFIADAYETGSLGPVSPSTRTNQELTILFNSVREFGATLEDTTTALEKGTGRK